MPYIIGTAGHIDHGKTTLIKALTGQDTDRLKEEKERGISIDLGFAHLALPDGSEAGIVDVPGHERFIRNMLAGAHGIDLVLFTVAADDGVMPQTEEHLDIVHLLGVRTALFVITKVDLVSEARVREVEEEIEILTFETALEGSPVVHFSAVSEAGLEDVRTRIFDLLQGIDRPAPSGFFRLPVDRVFVLQGHGVIITGTALAGEVRDRRARARVPGGQKIPRAQHSGPRPVGGSGGLGAARGPEPDGPGARRPGTRPHDLPRGAYLVSTRFDAHLEVRPAATKGIRNHQRVRIHLGTAERMGKLIFLGDTEKVEPKDTTYCQVLLTEPLLVMRGDHFIVRDETARRTLGGGEIVEPRAPRHRRREKDIEPRLRTLHHGDTPEMIRSFLDGDTSLATSVDSICQERVYMTEEKWNGFRERLRSSLKAFHQSHPLAPGMDLEEVRARLAASVSVRLFRDLTDLLASEGACVRDGNHVRLPDHRVELGAQEKSLSGEITAALAKTPLAPPYLKEIEKALAVQRPRLNEVIRVMERQGEIVRVTTELYYLKDSIDRIKSDLYSYFENHEEMSAATFRDILQSSRKYTIPVLEHFDRTGVTMRVGDVRKLKTGRS
ncbi:Selenocysteine-specific elongation factor [Geodia barretti]|uniref:protein-synthesizing GTPase n=1 Tax=Geodia barretti TaxID=519541 RepID=A0AA35T475_GEOBA|nr:Selenocysteine-specific elongation factor [Geodia barretti]